jgi:hypothetical protein
VDECKDKGSRRKKSQQDTGQIIVDTNRGSGNCQQAADRQEDEGFDPVVRG